MRFDLWQKLLLLLCAALLVGSCSEDSTGVAIPGGPGAPDSLTGTPMGLRLVVLHWSSVSRVSGYRIERRVGATGEFTRLDDVLSPGATTYSDATVQPETVYGYRVRGISTHGDAEGTSVVVGVVTPPVPGIAVSFQVGTPGQVDSNGYFLRITGGDPDTLIQTPVLPTDNRRFSPLRAGNYTVELDGVAANCSVDGGASRTIAVTDTGVQTLIQLPLQVSCRNPAVGRLQVQLATTGDSVDADGYVLTLSGVAGDTNLPDSARAYFRRDSVAVGAFDAFEALRPGDYTLKLTGVAGNCTASGATTRNFPVARLDDLRQNFDVTCQGSVDTSLPIVWQNHWSPASAPNGGHTALDVGLDMSAAPTQAVAGAQATLRYDAAVVRLDSVKAQGPWQASFNSHTAGQVIWVAFVTGSGVTGNTTFARFFFTAVGDSGTTTTTQSTITALADGGGANIVAQSRKTEGTFTVGTGSGSSNQAPVARAGGPYSGVAGTAITFSGTTSSDPDGTIANWAWIFGDGASGTGSAPSHSYTGAGAYTVTLTVTDNQGATAQSTATATITASGGGGNQPPVARAGGPYSGVAGTPVQFDGSASFDPDGTIASYHWDFGDGATGSGSNPVHSYATGGGYTVTLTVTDNGAATSQGTTTVTVANGSAHPFTWLNSFGPVNPADSMVTLSITLDLSTDIAETPGPEALQNWSVDSLKWNPTVLRYFSFNFGAGGGSVNPTDAVNHGVLAFTGVQSSAANSGVVPIATIRFKVIGSPGSTSQTTTALGPLLGTAATGSFSYGSRTSVVEGGVQAP